MSDNQKSVAVPVDRLELVHRDLYACRQVIRSCLPDVDVTYCTNALARLKEIESWLHAADCEFHGDVLIAERDVGGADHA